MLFLGHFLYVHRIIWVIVTGEQPKTIDHIDGNGLNNAVSNLRSVSQSENQKNLRISINNKSGIPGVFWHRKISKWWSYIEKDDKRISLGYFTDFFEACCARKSKEKELGFHKLHGTKK